MPIVVHDREAHGDVFALLRKYKPKALVHCFSGSVELMREAMRLGSYISLDGVVTFKNARHSVEVAGEIPLDRLRQLDDRVRGGKNSVSARTGRAGAAKHHR